MAEEKTPLKWKFSTEGIVISSPILSEGIVYFGSKDNHFYAVDVKTGDEIWKFETGDFIETTPTYFGEFVYFGSWDKHLYALDVKTGDEIWKFETKNYFKSSPIVSQGVVYFGSKDNHFYAVDAKTGEEKWEFKTVGKVNSSPTISEEIVYFGSDNGYLYAVDSNTGEEKWKFLAGIWGMSSPAVSDGVVYFGSNDNHLYALDAKTGKEKWKFETGDSVESSPAVSEGVVYFGSRDNHLYAVDIKTGKEKWEFKTGGAITSLSNISEGIVYFGSWDKHLYALDITAQEVAVATKVAADKADQEAQEEQKKIKKQEEEKRKHWKPDTEENLKKIQELMVSSQFNAGIELALTLDDQYLLLELVEDCDIGEDGKITLNDTFAANATGVNYDILVNALFKIIRMINDIQKPDSSLKTKNIKILDLHSFVKLPAEIGVFSNLKTIFISLRHGDNVPAEYSAIDSLKIKRYLIWPTIEEIPFNLDPAYLKEYGIENFGQKKVDPKLLPYIDNSFYAYLVEQGTEPFEFEYITFFNAMTHNLIEFDGKELKTYCVENYDLIDGDDDDDAYSKRDDIWYGAQDNESLPEEFYAYLEKYKGQKYPLQSSNVPKMFHKSV